MTFLTVWNAADKPEIAQKIFLGYLSPLLILSHVLRIILEMKRCVLLLITDSFYESYNKKVALIKLPSIVGKAADIFLLLIFSMKYFLLQTFSSPQCLGRLIAC